METILHFFVTYAPLIYLLFAVGLLLVGRNLFRSVMEERNSVFGLEREIAHQRTSRAVTILVILLLLTAGEMVLSVFLAQGLPASALLSTPTVNILAVPTSTLSPEIMATLSATTPLASTGAEASGCIPGQIMLTSPKVGAVVSGQVALDGTASIPNFGFYKYEFTQKGSEIWSTIQAGNIAIVNGTIGLWDTSGLIPGDYLLRLVVTDNIGNALPPCVVPVRVKGQ